MGSTKNTLNSFQCVTSGNMASAITSSVTSIQFMDNIGVQLNFAGASPTGTFAVQVSIDYKQQNEGGTPVVVNAGHWVPITFSSTPAATGTPDQIYLDMNQLSAPWIRVVFTPDGGGSVGTLNAYICGKAV